MCLLELDTLEYPYAECKNAAQIFKKVTSGMPPAGLDKVSCEELKTFISTCICHDPSKRPEARQLLKHPFFDCMRCVGGGAGVLGGLGPPVKSGVSLSAMSSQSALGGGTRGSSPADSHGHPSPVAGQRVHLPLPPSTASSGALGEQVAAAAAASVPHGLSRLAHATPPVLQPMERTGSLSMFPPSTSPGAAGGHMGSALPDPYGGPSPPVGAISASLGGRAASAAALTLPEVGQPGSLAPTPGSGLISASVRGSLCGASGPELQHLAGAGSQGLGAAAEQLQAAGALRRGGSSNGTAHGGTGTTSPLSSPLMQSPFSSSVAAPYPQSHGQPERQCSLDLDLNEGDVLFASDRGAPVASMHSDDVEGPLGERPVRSPSECDDAAGSRAGSSWVPIPAAGSGRMQSWSEDAGADDTALGLGEGPGSGAPGTSAASSLRPDLSMRLNMSCHQTQDDGLLSFSLSFVNHSGEWSW